MTDPTPAQYIPAGWYADPSGAPQQRWWDGIQWSATTQPNPAPVPAQPYLPMAAPGGYGATVPYTPGGQNFSLASGVNPNTPQVWAIAVVPLLVFVELLILLAMGELTVDLVMSPTSDMSTVNGADAILRFVAYVLVIVLAAVDSQQLARRGVDRPFHWAWAFLGMVYIIGRTVVVRRRTGRGLAPLFVWIGCLLASYIGPLTIGVLVALIFAQPFS